MSITSEQIDQAANELAAHVLERCTNTQVCVRSTPGDVKYDEYYIENSQVLGMTLAVQKALDGLPFEPWVYGSGEWAVERFGASPPEPDADARQIAWKICARAAQIIQEANERLRTEALKRDPKAGSEVVYSTSSS